MQPNSDWSVSQFNANIALRYRLYVSGFLLSGVLKDIRSGVLEARVDLHYEDDIPVGVAVLIMDGIPSDVLSSYYDLMIFVRKSYRNRGIGKQLINDMKVSTCLKVGRGSRYSLNFWQSQGFNPYE